MKQKSISASLEYITNGIVVSSKCPFCGCLLKITMDKCFRIKKKMFVNIM